jgi:hypothetical protein
LRLPSLEALSFHHVATSILLSESLTTNRNGCV